MANVNAARSHDGAISAEMRLEFEDLASIGMLLANTFHPRNIVDKVVAISSETIMALVNCYLTILFDPILINLARINTDLSSRELESFKDIITTIHYLTLLYSVESIICSQQQIRRLFPLI